MQGLVKVLATLGPSSGEPRVASAMARAGAAGFRVNMSHGDASQWDMLLSAVLRAEESAGRPLALIADLEGPRVRLGAVEPRRVRRGERVRLASTAGAGELPVDEPALFDVLEPGDEVLVDDGRIVLEVERVGGGWALARVVEGGVIGPRKGVAVRG